MGVTDLVSGLEKTITDLFSTTVSGVSLNKAGFKVVKVAENEYDVGMALPGVGTQHLRITISGHNFTISGNFDVIAGNASWPFSLAAAVVNNTVAGWVKGGLDAVDAGDKMPLALMGPVIPALAEPQVLVDSSK